MNCKLTGLDVNEGMLNAARKNPGVDWQLGSATAMPFPDASFDVVLCQQGLQYFPDRQAAMNEIARVLVPGGRVALNVWGTMDRQVFFAVLVEACATFLGSETRAAFALNYSLNTREELHALASAAGLKDAKVRFEHRTMRAPTPGEYGMGFIQASPVAAKFLALPDEDKQRFGAFIADRLASYVDDAGMAVPQENHFLPARKKGGETSGGAFQASYADGISGRHEFGIGGRLSPEYAGFIDVGPRLKRHFLSLLEMSLPAGGHILRETASQRFAG